MPYPFCMDYTLVKQWHLALVTLSITGFAVRWAARLGGAHWATRRLARTLPHVVDSVLLLSGLLLAAAWGSALGPWFMAKMAGLVLYVLLGVISLREATARPVRLAAGLGALAVVAWMVSVALTKQPRGFLGAWSG